MALHCCLQQLLPSSLRSACAQGRAVCMPSGASTTHQPAWPQLPPPVLILLFGSLRLRSCPVTATTHSERRRAPSLLASGWDWGSNTTCTGGGQHSRRRQLLCVAAATHTVLPTETSCNSLC